MNQEEFIKRLEEKQQEAERKYWASSKWDRDEFQGGRSEAYSEVLEKFVELLPPPTTLN